MLMMLACLGQVASESSPDADDADCFGAAVQEATQLMLMMLLCWGNCQARVHLILRMFAVLVCLCRKQPSLC